MRTRIRFRAPRYTGDQRKDFENQSRAIADYLAQLELKGSLSIDEADIRAADGIRFPASQGGASTDANTLDDYEEQTTTPTPTSFGGTLTTASASIRAQKVGNRVNYSVTVTDTTNGTGSGFIQVTMPFSAAETTATSGINATNPVALTGFISGTTLRIYKYDGTYPGADNTTLVMEGSYRV